MRTTAELVNARTLTHFFGPLLPFFRYIICHPPFSRYFHPFVFRSLSSTVSSFIPVEREHVVVFFCFGDDLHIKNHGFSSSPSSFPTSSRPERHVTHAHTNTVTDDHSSGPMDTWFQGLEWGDSPSVFNRPLGVTRVGLL